MNNNDNSYTFINPYNFVSSSFKDKSSGEMKDNCTGEMKDNCTGVIHCKLITKTPLAIPDVENKEKTDVDGHYKYPFFTMDEQQYVIPGSSLRGAIRSMYEAITDSCYSTIDINDRITFRSKSVFKPGILMKDKKGEWKLYKTESYKCKKKSKSNTPELNIDTAFRYLFKVDDKKYKSENKTTKDCTVLHLSDLIGKDSKYKHGQTVYFDPCYEYYHKDKKGNISFVGNVVKNLSLKKSNQTMEGIICVGEVLPLNKGKPQSNKHFESIFCSGYEEKDLVICDNLKDAVEDLDIILKSYRDEKINTNVKEKPFYPDRCYSDMKVGEKLPLWYQTYQIKNKETEKVTLVRLSVASMGRSVYTKSLENLLDQKVPCISRNNVCKACALFGMVGKNNEALGSKIRITDATFISGDKKEDITLKELATPKSSYLPFYGAGITDYKVKGYDEEGAAIRGRKFYWHNQKKNIYVDEKKTERNATMDLLENAEFTFDVYYDRISENQLKELVWTLTLGENDKDDHCHKIGHGKPIGLGSCKIKITSINQRLFENGKYENGTIGVNDIVKESNVLIASENYNQTVIKEVKTITSLNEVKDLNITYPNVVDSNGNFFTDASTNNKHAAHVWFSKNNGIGKSKPVILPSIENYKKNKLEYFEIKNNNQNYQNYNKRENKKSNQNQNKEKDKRVGVIDKVNTYYSNGKISFNDEKINFRFDAFSETDINKIKEGAKVEFIYNKKGQGTPFATECKIVEQEK